MDPAPFRERDLDPNAEAYIVEWAREEPRAGAAAAARRPPGPRAGGAGRSGALLHDAVHGYFRQRAQATRRELRRLFRVGRISLLIGLAFLAGRDRARRIHRRPRRQGAATAVIIKETLRHRRLGRAVAAARDLPLRLVADPRRGAAVRPPGRDGRAPCSARRPRRRQLERHALKRRPAARTRAPREPSGASRRAPPWRVPRVLRALDGAACRASKPGDLAIGAFATAAARPGSACACSRPHGGRCSFGALLALMPALRLGIGAGRGRRRPARVRSAPAARARVRRLPAATSRPASRATRSPRSPA